MATPYQNIAKAALINWNTKDLETAQIMANRQHKISNGEIKL